ncbi:uncharacterized protein LOC134701188 [Mytilus trossulus]|uniref:uncharacterized protein LOC134701188 n=1 Tax=Mytilus trossulus TaxID=6551 RepID=UPI0030074ED2
MEATGKQATSIEQPIESVNKVSTYASKKQNQNKSEFKQISCYACGFSGHHKTNPKCPAKGKKCRLCQNEGHFEKCCKSKKFFSKNHYSRKTNVRHVESADDTCNEPDYDNEDDDYAFSIHGNQCKVIKFTVNVGGIDVPVVIDSGATVWEKLVDFQLKIPIDKSIQPVIQPLRRIPYHLRGKLEEKLNELVEQDIIEAVNGPSQWTSPIVVVPKKNGDIRICVNMRRANLAVMRERYPIPTVDEVPGNLRFELK